MRSGRFAIHTLNVLLLAALAAALLSGTLPLGVRGEWQWPRLAIWPSGLDLGIGVLAVLIYAGFAALGMRSLRGHPSRLRQSAWVGVLGIAAVAIQIGLMSAAPSGYGLTKWVTAAIPGSSGYLRVAETQMDNVGTFWKHYPVWIAEQDVLHIGTHPPGLFLWHRGLLGIVRALPGVRRAILLGTPSSVSSGASLILGTVTPEVRAVVTLNGGLILLLCGLTVWPLYGLARSELSPASAWACASIWPLVPAAVLFQPVADAAFPILSTSALWLASGGGRVRCVVSGVILAVGMQLSLVFLPVGLAVGVLAAIRPDFMRYSHRLAAIVGIGGGFLGATLSIWGVSGANPFTIWAWNQANHARFYAEYPRTYRLWIGANLVELAVAVGLPVAIGIIATSAVRGPGRVAGVVLGVVLILNFSGKNLSEAARLWLPFLPSLLVGMGRWIERSFGDSRDLLAILILIGLETVLLEATIQVVYPF